jgi:hypothetical protein
MSTLVAAVEEGLSVPRPGVVLSFPEDLFADLRNLLVKVAPPTVKWKIGKPKSA